jgi:arginine metabolism regulation protein II
MYAHLRILVESTNIADGRASATKEQRALQWQAPENDKRVELHRFRIASNSLGDLDILRAKPEHVGYADIHLDATGVWLPTLFPDMFGIPELLMTLLSQTISLANARTKLDKAAIRDPVVGRAVTAHIKKLEECIWSLEPECAADLTSHSATRLVPVTAADTEQHEQRYSPDKLLTFAVHQALLIYFYRRIHNVSAHILQIYVRKLLEHIEPCMHTAKHDQDYGASIGWACFIAASEATTTELQERGLAYIEVLEARGNFVGLRRPRKIVQRVWEERTKARNTTFNWVDAVSSEVTSCA